MASVKGQHSVLMAPTKVNFFLVLHNNHQLLETWVKQT